MSEPLSLRGARVLLRPWTDADLEPFAAMNADPDVMRWFRAPLTRAESDAMAGRIRAHFAADGYGHWVLQTPELPFAGFVGMFPVLGFTLPFEGYADQPPREIGWRLPKAAWGHGYASEAAALVLAFARDSVRLPRVVSFTTLGNLKSQAVMQRIGLRRVGEFDHPNMPGHPIQRHVLYATAPDWAPR